MNILTVNTTASRGGAAAIAKVIHQCVNRYEELNSVFISGRKSDEQVDNIVDLGISSVRFFTNVFCYRMCGIEGLLNQKAWCRILAKYYSWADVIHLHNVHGYYLPENVLAELLKKPVVWTLHDYWLGTGRCAMPENCDGVERKCVPCPYPSRYPSMWFRKASQGKFCKESAVLNSTVQFIVPSYTSRDNLVRLGLPKSRLRIIENPLINFPNQVSELIPYESRQFLKLPLDRRIMIFIANRVDEPRKGFDVLLDALSLLPQQHNWYLVVIGEVTNKLRQKALSRPIEINFIGSIEERSILFKYLNASDCFINPSFSETFGLVNIEAIAAGCPVVCSDIPIFREFDFGGFRFFNPGDCNGLAQILIDMYENAFDLKYNTQLCAKIVHDRFSVEKACELYTKVYREVVRKQVEGVE